MRVRSGNGDSLFEHRCLLLWFDLINGGSLFEHRCGVYSSAIDAGSIWKWRLSMAVPSSSTDVYCSGSISSMAVPSSSTDGDYRSIQEAINAVASNNSQLIYISIKPGTYREKIAVPADKPFITLSGTDASTTIITWNDGGDIFNSPTVSSNFQVDVSSAANEEQQTSISQVIYVGVHIVSPLITLEMLKYPKLCYDYFALLSHMLEVYPEMIPKLNHEAFGHISGTLDFGLHHQDEEIVGMCLTSLRVVAIYHHKERGGGREGLGPQATSYKGPDGSFQDGILSRFLRSLLQLILFEDYSLLEVVKKRRQRRIFSIRGRK